MFGCVTVDQTAASWVDLEIENMDRVTATVQLYDEIMMKAGIFFVYFSFFAELMFEKMAVFLLRYV